MQQPLGTVRASERAIPDPQDIEEALGKMYRLRTQAPASLQASNDDDQAMVWQTLGAEIIRDSDRADSLADYCDECRYFFREKVYLGAFDLMPSTLPEKRRFLSLAIDQISADPSQRTLPALWMLHLKMILGLSRKIGKAEAGKLQKMQSEGNFATFAPSIPSVEVFEELMKSNNFIVSRYVAAERMYQPTFTTPYLE